MAAGGVSSFVIQLLGRWRSASYSKYIDITTATLSNAFVPVVLGKWEFGGATMHGFGGGVRDLRMCTQWGSWHAVKCWHMIDYFFSPQ